MRVLTIIRIIGETIRVFWPTLPPRTLIPDMPPANITSPGENIIPQPSGGGGDRATNRQLLRNIWENIKQIIDNLFNQD